MSSDRLSQIGKVLKTMAIQAGALAAIVAIDHTVRTFITHKFKQYTKKNDPKIEVKEMTSAAQSTQTTTTPKTNEVVETNNNDAKDAS